MLSINKQFANHSPIWRDNANKIGIINLSRHNFANVARCKKGYTDLTLFNKPERYKVKE